MSPDRFTDVIKRNDRSLLVFDVVSQKLLVKVTLRDDLRILLGDFDRMAISGVHVSGYAYAIRLFDCLF